MELIGLYGINAIDLPHSTYLYSMVYPSKLKEIVNI